MLNSISDEILVKRAKDGDDTSFTDLYLRYIPIIKAKSFLGSKLSLEKDDFFQEGSIGFIQAVRLYDPTKNSSFKTYATLCVQNKIISAYRKYKNDNKLDIINEDFFGDSCIASSEFFKSTDNVDDQQRVKDIFALVNKTLSKKELAVFHLYIKGYSYEEIASETNLTVKSVDNALQRVKLKLRKVI